MELEKQTDDILAIKVQDKRHYDRLITFLKLHKIEFTRTNLTADTVWQRVIAEGSRLRVLIVDTKQWELFFADTESYEAGIKDWNLLFTTEFKDQIVAAAERQGLNELTKIYRLKKDSVEIKAGAVVELCSDQIHYFLVNLDKRVFPEDSDAAFPNGDGICFSPATVEQQPEWFERVYQLNDYVTEAEYLAIKEQLQSGNK